MTGGAGLRGDFTSAIGIGTNQFRVVTTGGIQQGSVFVASLTPDQFRRVCEGCGDTMNGPRGYLNDMHRECWHAQESAGGATTNQPTPTK